MVIRWRWKEETTDDVEDDDRPVHSSPISEVKVPPTLPFSAVAKTPLPLFPSPSLSQGP